MTILFIDKVKGWILIINLFMAYEQLSANCNLLGRSAKWLLY